MTIGSRKLPVSTTMLAGLGGLTLALTAVYGACANEGDDDPDVISGCTLESCMSSCLAGGLPGGHCEGDLCLCDPPLPDADGDADGDGDAEDLPDETPDRTDVREDVVVDVEVADGETTDGEPPDGETTDGDVVEVVEDFVGPEDVGPRCTELAAAWTFNSGASGWTHEAVLAPPSGSFDPWELGTPTTGPEACHGSAATNLCWATGLDAAYPSCQRGALRSPTRNLAPCASSSYTVDLVFWHWYDFAAAAGSLDGALVELSGDDGATWTAIAPAGGWDGAIDMDSGCDGTLYTDGRDGFLRTSGRWVQETIRVPLELRTEESAFRFVFGSDSATQAAGWFVDDVALVVR
ncbi:MAG: hypothetical protein JXB32_22535 [Deltaproteobacteria bacterium]|nr:hypothetical protein [Deltaproteobacteria bacterium]